MSGAPREEGRRPRNRSLFSPSFFFLSRVVIRAHRSFEDAVTKCGAMPQRNHVADWLATLHVYVRRQCLNRHSARKELEHEYERARVLFSLYISFTRDGWDVGKTRARQCVENMDARFRDFGIFATRRISESSRVGENGAHFFWCFCSCALLVFSGLGEVLVMCF